MPFSWTLFVYDPFHFTFHTNIPPHPMRCSGQCYVTRSRKSEKSRKKNTTRTSSPPPPPWVFFFFFATHRGSVCHSQHLRSLFHFPPFSHMASLSFSTTKLMAGCEHSVRWSGGGANTFFFLFLFQNNNFFIPEGRHFSLHQTIDHQSRFLGRVFVLSSSWKGWGLRVTKEL